MPLPPSQRIPRLGDPAAVLTAIWPVVDLMRCLTLAYAAYEVWERRAGIARPALAWGMLAVLAAWTALVVMAKKRTAPWLFVESLLGCGAIVLTRWVDTPDVIASGASTVPGLWVAAAVVGWAVVAGSSGAMLAAVGVAAADVLEVGTMTSGTVRNIVLLFLMSACVGYCIDLLRESHAALTAALAVQARTVERDRLARTVHDGVLQTLSFIHRRGTDLGGDAHELGVLAAEQEAVLRTLISDSATDPRAVTGQADLRRLLERYGGGRVHIVTPAEAVLLPSGRAEELAMAVSAALDNVRAHAGPSASAWVLLEADEDEVLVTVRDDGVGVSEERLVEAMHAGRIGVARSIMGRLHDLGGEATYSSGGGTGTRLELRMPIAGSPNAQS